MSAKVFPVSALYVTALLTPYLLKRSIVVALPLPTTITKEHTNIWKPGLVSTQLQFVADQRRWDYSDRITSFQTVVVVVVVNLQSLNHNYIYVRT